MVVRGCFDFYFFNSQLNFYFYFSAVNPDNLLFISAQEADDIRQAISASPSNKAEEVTGSDGAVYHVVKSQPIEHGFKWNEPREAFADASICLSNFGYGKSFACGRVAHK
jgi:hypothetical protein